MAGGFQSDIPPAVNQTAKKYIRGMMKGRHRWNKLYGSRSKEVIHKTANKMAMGEMQKMPPTYNEIFGEANKSGDSSLRDWFSKSRSSDGTPGWVQLGGKYAGKPCAKQPGQTTKPKCGSSKMKRDLNNDEEERAFRRKNRQDPNPDRQGRAKNVATEETIREAGDYWHPDPKKDAQISGAGNKARAREDAAERSKPKPDPKKLRPGETYMQYAKRHGKKSTPAPEPKERKRDKIGRAIGRVIDKVGGIKSSYEPDGNMIREGEKDACYKKVKSRYKVWPSAYASGALVKCRKKGAANWGNKSEGIIFQQFQEKALKCWKDCRRVPGTTPGAKGSCTCEDTVAEGDAWTKKAGQNKEGGLNEKGRKSYERENPGSDLKAPSKKVGNPRRASFCARMKGMRKRQKPSNNTGDDRLSKSLRVWNC
jgi:hypothetical protein